MNPQSSIRGIAANDLAAILVHLKDYENVDSENNEEWFEGDCTILGFVYIGQQGQTIGTDIKVWIKKC